MCIVSKQSREGSQGLGLGLGLGRRRDQIRVERRREESRPEGGRSIRRRPRAGSNFPSPPSSYIMFLSLPLPPPLVDVVDISQPQ